METQRLHGLKQNKLVEKVSAPAETRKKNEGKKKKLLHMKSKQCVISDVILNFFIQGAVMAVVVIAKTV